MKAAVFMQRISGKGVFTAVCCTASHFPCIAAMSKENAQNLDVHHVLSRHDRGSGTWLGQDKISVAVSGCFSNCPYVSTPFLELVYTLVEVLYNLF